jgi:hypothetical protein
LLEGVEACSEDADWERVPGVQSSEAPAKQSATMVFFMMCSLFFAEVSVVSKIVPTGDWWSNRYFCQ